MVKDNFLSPVRAILGLPYFSGSDQIVSLLLVNDLTGNTGRILNEYGKNLVGRREARPYLVQAISCPHVVCHFIIEQGQDPSDDLACSVPDRLLPQIGFGYPV